MTVWSPSTPRRSTSLITAMVVSLVVAGCATYERVSDGIVEVGGDLRQIVVGPSAPSPAEEVAKADHSEREGGIGGTGVETAETPSEPSLAEQALAGKGRIGVFGAVTGFGSIFVNGERVFVADRMPVASRIGAKRGEEIELGEVVAVIGSDGDEALRADMVEVFLPIVGSILTMSEDRSVINVMGTAVVVPEDAPVVDHETGQPIDRNILSSGDPIAVSGLWWNERIIATRVALLPRPMLSSISGQVRLDGGVAVIGSTRVVASDVRENGFATAFGRYQAGSLVAARLDYKPLGVFSQPAETLIIEGYLSPNPGDDGFHLSGFGLPLDPSSPIERRINARAVFSGEFDTDFQAEMLETLPETAAERREALRPAP